MTDVIALTAPDIRVGDRITVRGNSGALGANGIPLTRDVTIEVTAALVWCVIGARREVSGIALRADGEYRAGTPSRTVDVAAGEYDVISQVERPAVAAAPTGTDDGEHPIPLTSQTGQHHSPTRRGRHQFDQPSRQAGRDLCGEQVAQHYGQTAHGYRMTATQLAESRANLPGTGEPYEYRVYNPGRVDRTWQAFYTRAELADWLDAYALTIDHEPGPGRTFAVRLPFDDAEWRPLR